MHIKELREKAKPELELLLVQHKEKLRKLRFDLARAKLKNVREIRSTKKVIAQIHTLLQSHPHA